MARQRTYYDLLDVARDATPDDIRSAYRRLAVKHHPDRGGKPAKFDEITRARDTLLDSDRRANYDRQLVEKAARSPAARTTVVPWSATPSVPHGPYGPPEPDRSYGDIGLAPRPWWSSHDAARALVWGLSAGAWEMASARAVAGPPAGPVETVFVIGGCAALVGPAVLRGLDRVSTRRRRQVLIGGWLVVAGFPAVIALASLGIAVGALVGFGLLARSAWRAVRRHSE